MAGETKLGTAVVPIRATMDELDKDLAQAKAKCESAGSGLSRALSRITWGAVGAGATAAAGALADLARAGAEDEASFRAVEVALGNAAAQFDTTTASLAQNETMLEEYSRAIADVQQRWSAAQLRLHEATVELASITDTSKEATARKKELAAEISKLERETKAYAREAGELYDEQDKLTAAVQRQRGQIQSMGVDTGVAAEQIAQFIDRLRDTAAIADDESKPALAGLIAVTSDYQRSMELASLAADLARGKHMSYQSAAELVGKVAQGNTAILTRYGIVLGENATAEEALAELQKRFAGQAEAYGKTSQGQIEIVGLKIADFREQVGQTMGPAMTFVGLLPGLSAGFTMAGGAVGTVLPMLGAVGPALTGSVIPAIGATVVALGPILLIIAAVIAVAGLLYLAYQSNFLGIRDITDSVVGWIKGFIGSALESITSFWSEHWNEISSVVSFVWDAMTLGVRVAWTLLSGIVTAGLQILQGDWDGAWQTIQNTLGSAWDQIQSVVKRGVNTIIGFINHLIGAWNALSFTIPGFGVQLPSVDIPRVGRVGGGQLGWEGVNISTPDLPKIRMLDSGGIVTRPTLAALAMNSRAEAVVPLDGSAALRPSITINGPLIGEVTVRDEADEDRLVRKLWTLLTSDRDLVLSGGVV